MILNLFSELEKWEFNSLRQAFIKSAGLKAAEIQKMSGQDDKFWYIDVVRIRYDQFVRLLGEEEIEISTLPDKLREAMDKYRTANNFYYCNQFMGALRECSSAIPLSSRAREELEWLLIARDPDVEQRYQK